MSILFAPRLFEQLLTRRCSISYSCSSYFTHKLFLHVARRLQPIFTSRMFRQYYSQPWLFQQLPIRMLFQQLPIPKPFQELITPMVFQHILTPKQSEKLYPIEAVPAAILPFKTLIQLLVPRLFQQLLTPMLFQKKLVIQTLF